MKFRDFLNVKIADSDVSRFIGTMNDANRNSYFKIAFF